MITNFHKFFCESSFKATWRFHAYFYPHKSSYFLRHQNTLETPEPSHTKFSRNIHATTVLDMENSPSHVSTFRDNPFKWNQTQNVQMVQLTARTHPGPRLGKCTGDEVTIFFIVPQLKFVFSSNSMHMGTPCLQKWQSRSLQTWDHMVLRLLRKAHQDVHLSDRSKVHVGA
jgi:hypothetical protein